MEGAARNIDYAVLASIALHGLLLFGVSVVSESTHRRASVPVPIAARLAEPPALAPQPAPVTPAAPRVRKQPIRPGAGIPAALSDPAPAAEVIPAAAPAPAPVAVQIPAAPSGEAASAPVDAATLGQYRIQLIGAARRFKRYPESARENNWSGNVVIAMAFGADGRSETSVRKSSGRPVLDQQALEMFQQAAKAVPIPPALRGRVFSLEVRAIYGLED